MQIQDIMTADPACCTADMRLQDVARLMLDHDCGEIPVLDDFETRRLVGVVTDRDIAVRGVADGRSPTDTQVSDIMSSAVVTARLDSSVDECVELMEKHQIRRIPIVDSEGRCCGIVAQADIALRADEQETGEVVRRVSNPTSASAASPHVRM